jgi:hypothetical protein
MRYRDVLAIFVATGICVCPLDIWAGDNSKMSSALLNCGAFASSNNLPTPSPQTDPEAIERAEEINRQANTASHPLLFLVIH